MKICMAGACGRMGRRILELAAAAEDIEIGGAFDIPDLAGTELTVGGESGNARTVAVSSDAAAEIAKSDVLIDFSLAAGCVDNVRTAVAAGKPAVIGTTGLTDAHKSAIAEMARETAIVFAPNFSVGVNLLFKLVSEAAAVLGLDYNCEITEIHHNKKQDSPSGTAERLGERAAEALGLSYGADTVHGRQGLIGARPANQIGMHSVRGGDVVGEHTVHFFGPGERIELTHKAHSRDTFASGALRAARFVAGAAPGLYDMQDVLGLK